MPLASGLAAEVVRARSALAPMIPDDAERAAEWLVEEYNLTVTNAEAIVRQFTAQARVSAIPTARDFLIEVYHEGPVVHHFFHALIGRSANDALSRIMALRVNKRLGGNALITIDDYGILLSLRDFQAMALDDWRELLSPEGAEADLHEALKPSGLVKVAVPRRGAERA